MSCTISSKETHDSEVLSVACEISSTVQRIRKEQLLQADLFMISNYHVPHNSTASLLAIITASPITTQLRLMIFLIYLILLSSRLA